MIGYDEAVRRIVAAAEPLGIDRVPLARAHRHVLAGPVEAQVDSPPADVSAMDGYAVRDADLAALPARLTVIGESSPGKGFEHTIGAGQCVRIFTGAPLPPCAERIVIQEQVRRDGDAAIIAAKPQGRHIRRRGSDFAKGDQLLAPGRLLDSRALVAAAAADLAELDIYRRPRLAILSTGDELAEPGEARDTPGAIPDSVSLGVAALAADWGADIIARHRLADDLPAMITAARRALDCADLVVVTGGASVGERDFAKAMFDPAGLELLFSKVLIKPGKPVWFGRAQGKLILGLPGNPTSAIVTARMVLAVLLVTVSGRDPADALRWRPAPLDGSQPPTGPRETFVRAARTEAGVRPLGNQDSGSQNSLAAADVLIRRRADSPAIRAGEMVETLDF